MARAVLVVAAAAAAATTAAATTLRAPPSPSPPPPPPLWGPVMTAPFNQTITILGYTWSNSVQYFYDSTTQPVGQSLYIHSQGQHDEICTGVVGFENSEEPCSLLASNDTWRYVFYPQSSFCCRVCNTSQYCGIISPTWLQQNATYQGTAVKNGVLSYGWEKTGGEQNYAWFAVGTAAGGSLQPVQYYEGYPVFEVGNNTWNFDTAAFSRAPIPGSTFTVPTGMGCPQMCNMTTVSYADRLAARLGRRRQ